MGLTIRLDVKSNIPINSRGVHVFRCAMHVKKLFWLNCEYRICVIPK